MVLFLGTDVSNKKLPQDNLVSCFYNHNELDLRNGFFREEEVFVWALYKYTIKTQEICLQISAVLGERVYVVTKKVILMKTWHCKLCKTNFSVAAGVLYDIKKHSKRSTHVTAVEASSKTKSITNFVDKKSSSVILS